MRLQSEYTTHIGDSWQTRRVGAKLIELDHRLSYAYEMRTLNQESYSRYRQAYYTLQEFSRRTTQ